LCFSPPVYNPEILFASQIICPISALQCQKILNVPALHT
jgi:hypothetical protein